ncbi:MAG: nitrate/nitrite transporter NrtS [Acidimicrobiales bacterium]
MRFCFQTAYLRRTITIAVVVGTLLSLVNQLHVLLDGSPDVGTWLRIAANYVIPFMVSNVGGLTATRATRAPREH